MFRHKSQIQILEHAKQMLQFEPQRPRLRPPREGPRLAPVPLAARRRLPPSPRAASATPLSGWHTLSSEAASTDCTTACAESIFDKAVLAASARASTDWHLAHNLRMRTHAVATASCHQNRPARAGVRRRGWGSPARRRRMTQHSAPCHKSRWASRCAEDLRCIACPRRRQRMWSKTCSSGALRGPDANACEMLEHAPEKISA